MWECEWWWLYKVDTSVKQSFSELFPFKRPLGEKQLKEKKLYWVPFLIMYNVIFVFQSIWEKSLLNFLQVLKKTNACRQYIGSLTQYYAERDWLMSQPRPMLISSFELRIELSLPRYFCSIGSWVSSLKKLTDSLITDLSNDSATCNLLLTLYGKKTKIPVPILLQKQSNCSWTVLMVMKSWIAIVISLQNT